jgi:predicted regulator of Ras-like GTPase activity (Roadblock/LC7/MglB family)
MGFKFKELFWVSDERDDDDGRETPPGPAPFSGSAPAAPPSATGVSSEVQVSPVSGHRLQGGQVEIQRALATLRDVSGVVGSLLIGTDGVLLACDLPAFFQAETPERVAGRIAQLYAAVGQAGEPRQKIAARYGQHVFHIAESPAGLIGVLAEQECNGPALGMALRLVGRRISGAASSSV